MRRIGPVGTATRVAGGLAAIGVPAALHGITWWDVGAALVVLPVVAMVVGGFVTAADRRRPSARFRPTTEAWIRSSVALALVLGLGTTVTFVSPVDATAIWLFIGLSLLIAALRGDAGCEVIAIPNTLAGRKDPVGCMIYAPIDAVERRRAEATPGTYPTGAWR